MKILNSCKNAQQLLLEVLKIIIRKDYNAISFSDFDRYSLARSKFSLNKEKLLKKEYITKELIFDCDKFSEQIPAIINFVKNIKFEELKKDNRSIKIIGNIPKEYSENELKEAL